MCRASFIKIALGSVLLTQTTDTNGSLCGKSAGRNICSAARQHQPQVDAVGCNRSWLRRLAFFLLVFYTRPSSKEGNHSAYGITGKDSIPPLFRILRANKQDAQCEVKAEVNERFLWARSRTRVTSQLHVCPQGATHVCANRLFPSL